VGLRLGCLNHARLTVEAIAATGRCPVLGWGRQPDRRRVRADGCNLATLERLLGSPPLAVLPPLEQPRAAEAAVWLDGAYLLAALGIAD